MKAWVKGGLWGGLVGFIILTFLVLIIPFFLRLIDPNLPGIGSPISRFYFDTVVILYSFDFLSWIFCGGICNGEEGIIQIITLPLVYIMIGALVGVIVSKIKNRSKVVENAENNN